MFCPNEGRDEPERDRRRRERRRPGNLPSAILGPIVLEPRRHRDEEPLCEGPNALVVPRLPASRLRSIKRLFNWSFDRRFDGDRAARTNSSYCPALISGLSCIRLHSRRGRRVTFSRDKLSIGNSARFNNRRRRFDCITNFKMVRSNFRVNLYMYTASKHLKIEIFLSISYIYSLCIIKLPRHSIAFSHFYLETSIR